MTNEKKAPERIWAHPTEREPMPARLKSHARWRRGKWKDHDSNAHGDVEYVRHDHALALVAAAYEDAATTASCECQCGPVSLETKILRRTPTDAQAALEARDNRVREDERKRIKMGFELQEDENPRSTKEPFSEYGHYGENNPPVGMSSPGDKDYEV